MFCALAATALAATGSAAATPAMTEALVAVARGSSPRVEVVGPGVVVLDARGLQRLFGRDVQVAALCRRQAAERGVDAAVAIAPTRTAALLLALAGRDRVIVAAGGEAAAVAPLPIGLLARLVAFETPPDPSAGPRRARRAAAGDPAAGLPLATWRRWGLGTLGALAALPPADLFERMGAPGLAWQAMARGADARPLVPTAEPEPFEATCAFDWPVDAIEPLSFALGRVVDPLCARLDRDGLGTVVLQTTLRLTTRELYVRRLSLPMPMRDARVLRTLVVLDLESHPPPAGIDALTLRFEPVPGRIVQPSLLARAHPRPEALATLTARLRAVMGDGRVGSPVAVDTPRGGAFAMRPLTPPDGVPIGPPAAVAVADGAAAPVLPIVLRRFRQPPRVRVDLERGRPVRVCALEPRRLPRLGAVRQAAGPWRSSGDWWRRGEGSVGEGAVPRARSVMAPWAPGVWRADPAIWSDEPVAPWDDDEWDVVVETGVALRLARDRTQDTWVVAALVD
jgi:protein ImuB